MATPIYVLVIAKGYNEQGLRITEEERADLWAKVQEADHRAGAKWVIACDSRWADESTSTWVVLEYPDMESYLTKVQELEKLQWWRYFESKSLLGTRIAT